MVFLVFLSVNAKLLRRVWLVVTLWAVAHKAPLFMGFFRQKYWRGLPFPPPGHLTDPGVEPTSPMSPASQVDALPAELYWGFPSGSDGEESVCNAGDRVWSLGEEDPLKKGMATHTPRKTPYSCLENSMDKGANQSWRVSITTLRSSRTDLAWISKHRLYVSPKVKIHCSPWNWDYLPLLSH